MVSSKNLNNKVPKKSIFVAFENSLKTMEYFCMLKKTRIEDTNTVIIGSLNINYLSPKIDDLKVFVTGMLDITETKMDNTFLVSWFYIDGYSRPYRLERNINGVI